MHTPVCDMLGIEFPIFAFSHCRDVVAAVSKAGGMGVLGAVAFAPDQLEVELAWIDEHVDGKPYGVDVVIPAKYEGAALRRVEHRRGAAEADPASATSSSSRTCSTSTTSRSSPPTTPRLRRCSGGRTPPRGRSSRCASSIRSRCS